MTGDVQGVKPTERDEHPDLHSTATEPQGNPPPAAPDPSATQRAVSQVSQQVALALNEWIAGVMPPVDPPFSKAATFPDSEWSHFFRIFSITTAMSAAVVLGMGVYNNSNKASITTKALGAAIPSGASLAAISSFGLCALLYYIVAQLFKIKITFRQAMFCFALVITPSVPLILLIKVLGANLGLAWFFMIEGLFLYELFLLVSAIGMVTGASRARVIFSLIPMIGLAALAALK